MYLNKTGCGAATKIKALFTPFYFVLLSPFTIFA